MTLDDERGRKRRTRCTPCDFDPGQTVTQMICKSMIEPLRKSRERYSSRLSPEDKTRCCEFFSSVPCKYPSLYTPPLASLSSGSSSSSVSTKRLSRRGTNVARGEQWRSLRGRLGQWLRLLQPHPSAKPGPEAPSAPGGRAVPGWPGSGAID